VKSKPQKPDFTTAQVVCVTATINHKFISFSAVQIYDLSYMYIHLYVISVNKTSVVDMKMLISAAETYLSYITGVECAQTL